MKLSIKYLRRILREEISKLTEPYVVRGNSEVLVKRSGADWAWTVLCKVTYFNSDVLVKGPWSQTQEQVWKFSVNGDIYAIRDEQFLSRPQWKYKARR